MGESVKVVAALFMIVCAVVAAVAWTADKPDMTTWLLRIGGLLLACLSLALILKLHFRRDLEHDYLKKQCGTYFNRDGFGFSITATENDGVGHLNACFLNQYAEPCVGRIALRPARGFFMNRAKIDAITYEISCGPGAYGFASIPIPIAQKMQGKRQSFDVGASVEYPNGKRKRLRFHDGISIRANTNFGSTFSTALIVAGAATGSLVLISPPKTTVKMPKDVAEEVPVNHNPKITTLWQLGDPPINNQDRPQV